MKIINVTLPPANPATAHPAGPGWRTLALAYDFFPLLAIWFCTSLVIYLLRNEVPVRPGSLMAWLELVVLWLLTGVYVVVSWRRGGQTIGMRPWRLKVLAADGRQASWGALCIRYGVATLTLGLGLLSCLFDSQRRAVYDFAADTRFVRLDAVGPMSGKSEPVDATAAESPEP